MVTYFLAVGDRHLENLLIDQTGHLFHVDFGFIFGKNPPFKNTAQPPIRICLEMMEALGGPKSKDYTEFLETCVQCFAYLRKYRNHIINMVYLMIHAGIPDIQADYQKVLNDLNQKFMPLKSQQEASEDFRKVVKESVNAFFPKVLDTIHVWATYMK